MYGLRPQITPTIVIQMKLVVQELALYLRLAQAFKNKMEMLNRDRALVLAGVCAAILEMKGIAAFCRKLILQNNHGHMMKRWPTFTDALQAEDFHVFLKQIRRRFPVERAEITLVELGYQCDIRPEDYNSDEEYAAAVMGVDHEWITEHFE